MTVRGLRVLFSCFGSAGDLFPLMPAIRLLQSSGHDVRCATPRSLGLYLRAGGISPLSLGNGNELSVFKDPSIHTTRFDGWSSWRRTLLSYVAPALADDVRRIDGLIVEWKPDVIVTSGFAVAARVAAHRHGIPLVCCTIYPQHELVAQRSASRFARPCVEMVRTLAGPNADVARLMWGAPADLVLHDSLLLSASTDLQPAGFPYWDDIGGDPHDLHALDAWLERPGPHVAVTLGSFLGVTQHDAWRKAAEAVALLGVSAVFIGARARMEQPKVVGNAGVLRTGFVPMSGVLSRFDIAVHHGGIGTTFGVLRSGRPAVVLPQAFDQSFNARMVEDAGIGLDASARPLSVALDEALRSHVLRSRPPEVAGQLQSSDSATRRVRDVILRSAGQSS